MVFMRPRLPAEHQAFCMATAHISYKESLGDHALSSAMAPQHDRERVAREAPCGFYRIQHDGRVHGVAKGSFKMEPAAVLRRPLRLTNATSR